MDATGLFCRLQQGSFEGAFEFVCGCNRPLVSSQQGSGVGTIRIFYEQPPILGFCVGAIGLF